MDAEEVDPNLCEEYLLAKHKQEKKDLQSKIQGLKKSVPKGDKKKKKEVAEEIAKLEQDLETRQNEELALIKPNNGETAEDVGDTVEEEQTVEDDEPVRNNTRVSRAQKRRNKKAAEEKEREKRISEQAEKNKGGPRVLELNAIKEVLKSLNLKIYDVPADGNCLYCAVNHQLDIKGKPSYTVNELRKTTADFMLKNKDDFLPFMYNEFDDSGTVSEEEFAKYCKEVASTKLWGGQLELKALSNILHCPIKIIQASGPPTIQGEGLEGPELILTYHRHLYRLGEHYNSTISSGKDDDEDDC